MKINKTLNEVTLKNGSQADTDLYHFFTSMSDLVSSLKDKNIFSNKNEKASQFDIQAAWDAETGLKDDAYVCFTTYPGKKGIYQGYERPFGLSFQSTSFDTDTSATKPFSQAAAKTCDNLKDSQLLQNLQVEYSQKYNNKYGKSFIEDLPNQAFTIQAIGIVPVTDKEKEIYKNSLDPAFKYFISGGDNARPWTARYFPITAESTKLYKLVTDYFKQLINSPVYASQVYWFDSNNYIGTSQQSFDLKDFKINDNNNKISLDNQTFSGNLVTVNPQTNKNIKHNIYPRYNLNSNYRPRPDKKIHRDANGRGIVKFNATIDFPANFTAFKEIIGIGRIFWDNLSSKNNFDFVNVNSRGGNGGVNIKGFKADNILKFLADMEKYDYDIDKINLPDSAFSQKERSRKTVYLDNLTFKSFAGVFNEHEKRVYVQNKKNLTFSYNNLNSIILPNSCKIASQEVNLENLVQYISQYTDFDMKTINAQQLAWYKTRKTKAEWSLIQFPDSLSAPSQMSDLALSCLLHNKYGIKTCIEQQILEKQNDEYNEYIKQHNLRPTAHSFKYSAYVLRLIRAFCKLIDSPASPCAHIQVELLDDASTATHKSRVVTAYKTALSDLSTLVQADTVGVDKENQFVGIDPKFFKPSNNANSTPDHIRYLINIDKYFDISQVRTDSEDKIYENETSIVVPLKTDNSRLARVGAEALIIGYDQEGSAYLLMVQKPHLSSNFLELPGGGLTYISSVTQTSGWMSELKKKVKVKTGLTDIIYTKQYPLQLMYSEESISKNKALTEKIAYSVYFLAGGIYNQIIDPANLEFRNQNSQYNAYMIWLPLDTLELKDVFLNRYVKVLPYIKALAAANQKKVSINKEPTINTENDNKTEVADIALDENLLSKFFKSFWN